MMAVFSEMERDAISKRTKEALAAAKARGVRLGNPRLAQARAGVTNTEKRRQQPAWSRQGPICARHQDGSWWRMDAVRVSDILRRA
jgi:DNA invertase Pin-like site-specific DNA recombinase